MSKEKEEEKLKCYCFMASLLDEEGLAVGYIMEANKKEAYDCVEKYILDKYEGYSGELYLVCTEGDEDMWGTFNPSHPRYKGEISMVEIEEQELMSNVCRSLFRLLERAGTRKENTEWVN